MDFYSCWCLYRCILGFNVCIVIVFVSVKDGDEMILLIKIMINNIMKSFLVFGIFGVFFFLLV